MAAPRRVCGVAHPALPGVTCECTLERVWGGWGVGHYEAHEPERDWHVWHMGWADEVAWERRVGRVGAQSYDTALEDWRERREDVRGRMLPHERERGWK